MMPFLYFFLDGELSWIVKLMLFFCYSGNYNQKRLSRIENLKRNGYLPMNFRRICTLEEKGEESACLTSTKFVYWLFLT